MVEIIATQNSNYMQVMNRLVLVLKIIGDLRK